MPRPFEDLAAQRAHARIASLVVFRSWLHWFSLGLGLACLQPMAADAAEPGWLVIPVDVATGAGTPAALVRETEQALAARGLRVIAASTAAATFERQHSRSAYVVRSGELEQLDALQQELDVELAAEDTSGISDKLAALDRVSPDLRDQRNRDVQRARRAFHSCLAAAFVFERKGDARLVQEQLSACARDFPGLDPELPAAAPSAIAGAREFVTRARALLAEAPPSTVRIDVDGVKKGTRCFVRVNGLDRGGTPVTLAQLRAPAIRVQVECGKQPARIYTLGLSEPERALRVDASLDAAVTTQAGLGLSYPDAATADAQRVKHGLLLARTLGAGQLMQLFQGKLRRIDVASGRELASDAVGAGGATLRKAIDFVLSNGELPLSAARPAQGSARSAAAAQSADERPTAVVPGVAASANPAPKYAAETSEPVRRRPPARVFRTLGYVGIGLTLAAAAVTIVAWRVHEGHISKFNDRIECTDTEVADLDASCKHELSSANSANSVMFAGAIAGGASLVLTGVFFLLDANRPRERESFACAGGPGELGLGCMLHF